MHAIAVAQIGRYINHAAGGEAGIGGQANCRPHRPLFVRGKWRVGFISTRDIKAGEELLYDYRVRSQVPLPSVDHLVISTHCSACVWSSSTLSTL